MDIGTPNTCRIVYARLLRRQMEIPALPEHREARWAALMAAHVVGQASFPLHWDSHVRMLGLAWEIRDPGEVAGQLLRLALVPLGHALGRLPAGNVGRATVNAFRPMEPPAEVRALIAWAVRSEAPL
jgi:hypothetical protein